jgi:hypothetical protein
MWRVVERLMCIERMVDDSGCSVVVAVEASLAFDELDIGVAGDTLLETEVRAAVDHQLGHLEQVVVVVDGGSAPFATADVDIGTVALEEAVVDERTVA